MLSSLATMLCLATAGTQLEIPYEQYVLEENGLTVILSQDHSLPIVAVNVWYHAGPVNEPPQRSGFAHLFEHLMFQGSAHVGDDQHFKLLDSAGATGINGTTSYDRTNYFQTVPKNQLPLALWLESDRMGFLPPALTQETLDNQRDVVKNERRQSVENVPYGPSAEALVQTLFPPDHPYYGYVIGSMEDLSAATLEDVNEFYERYYAPGNATLAIVGDFDKEEAKQLVAKYFGTLPRRNAPPPVEVVTPPLEAERRVVVQEPVQLPRITMAWLSPKAYAPGDAEADVLSLALGGGKSSRLYQRLVYDLQIAQDVSVHQRSYAVTSMFTVSVTARPGVAIEQIETELQKELDRIRIEPPTEREITRARNILVSSLVKGLQQVGGFGGRADTLNRYHFYVGDPGYFAKDLARYDNISPESVQQFANSLLDPNNRAVVITEPK